MKDKPSAALCIQRLVRLKKKRLPEKEFFKLWGMIRSDLYETPEYQTFLREVRARSGHRCTGFLCFKRGRHVHHKIPVYKDPTKALDIDNGTYLCIPCHRKEHKKPSSAKKDGLPKSVEARRFS